MHAFTGNSQLSVSVLGDKRHLLEEGTVHMVLEACPWIDTEVEVVLDDMACQLVLSCSEIYPKTNGHESFQLDTLASG